jgi:uncharacterized protein DUF3726
MRRTLNEIEVGLRKAAIGAGFPLGLAEEIGRAGMVMCGLGGDGVGAVLARLDGSGLGEIVSALDLLGAGVQDDAQFSGGDFPLVQAFAIVAGQAQGRGFDVVNEDGATVVTRGEFSAPSLLNGAEVPETDWQNVVALVQKTFVPASEASRLKGAGAGMTDND